MKAQKGATVLVRYNVSPGPTTREAEAKVIDVRPSGAIDVKLKHSTRKGSTVVTLTNLVHDPKRRSVPSWAEVPKAEKPKAKSKGKDGGKGGGDKNPAGEGAGGGGDKSPPAGGGKAA